MAYYKQKEVLYSDKSDWSLKEKQPLANKGRREYQWVEDKYDSEYEEDCHEEELEPEPPDRHQLYPNKHRNMPLFNKTESEFSYDDRFEHRENVGFHHHKSPPRRDVKPHNHTILSPPLQGLSNHTRHPKPHIGISQNFYNCGTKLPSFSGKEAYIQWEDDMEAYFWRHKILEKEKLSYALSTLCGGALKWWNKEEDERWYYKEPIIKTWGELKRLMYDEYSPQSLRKHSQHPHLPSKASRDKLTPKVVQLAKNTKAKDQGKCLLSKSSLELMCYRCKQQGHIAKLCPSRNKLAQEEQHLSLDPYPNDAKVSTSKDLNETLKALNYVIESLKEVKIGSCAEKKTHQVPLVDMKAKLELVVVPSPKEKRLKDEISPTYFAFQKPVIMHLPLSKNVETGLGATREAGNAGNTLLIKEEPPDLQVVVQENKEDKTSEKRPQMHHETISKQAMEMTLVKGDPQPNKAKTNPWKSVLYSLLIKEEPPDKNTKPSDKQYLGGKLLNPLYQTKPNLPSLCAGKIVLRTKPFEEGGNNGILDRNNLTEDDTIREGRGKTQSNQNDLYERDVKKSNHIEALGEIKIITTQPCPMKTQPRLHLPYLDANKDMRSQFAAFQITKNSPSYEVTFYGFMTQEANSSRLNHSKRSSESKVMNCRSWTSCAMAVAAPTTLIRPHSPTQMRPRNETNWRLFVSLLRIQQDQELSQPPPEPPDTLQSRRWSDQAAIPSKIRSYSPDPMRPGPRTNWRFFLGLLRIQQAQERPNPPPEPPDTLPSRKRSDLGRTSISTAPRSMALITCPLDTFLFNISALF